MMPETFMTLLPTGYDAGTWGAIALAKQALDLERNHMLRDSSQWAVDSKQ